MSETSGKDMRASQWVFRTSALGCIYVVAFLIRLFAVIRFESVIHEFDPYFNYRTTKFLAGEGFYDFLNWFDDRAWYPLGRIVGGTIYPGLMMTASALHWGLNALNITVNIRNVCVFLAPWMASNTALTAYFMTKEAVLGPRSSTAGAQAASSVERRAEGAGLMAAAFICICPGYISRSVAGSYDNEGVAIFALLFTYFLWLRAVNLGSLAYASAAALAYFYMVSAWGGYVFIINLIPIHVLALLASGMYSSRLYIAYSTFFMLGTMLSMQIPFVGFQPVFSSEHIAAMGTFCLLQVVQFVVYIRSMLDDAQFKQLVGLVQMAAVTTAGVGLAVGTATGYLTPMTGRFYSLLDPTYAKKHIPIIASVSESQPTSWSSFFFDLHILTFLFPAGVWFAIRNANDSKVFLVCYAVTATYFSGVMVRLMLVLTPIACVLGALALSEALSRHMSYIQTAPFLAALVGRSVETDAGPVVTGTQSRKAEKRATKERAGRVATETMQGVSAMFVMGATLMCCFYALHCTWVSSSAYSSPSIVLAAKQADGSRLIFDDFREAYWWLRQNTEEDAKVMSWWDYGYQITAMANRTIIVDNNTWNNTHIATVGRAMASTEEDAYPIMQSLDVDYVLVIFGGITGYQSDDINKFLWMVRIGGGVFPHIKEPDYFAGPGNFNVGAGGAPALLNCMMYKLCYYRFGEMRTDARSPPGYDRVRNVEIGNKDLKLVHTEEAFTSEHWIVRIYKVNKDPILA